MLLTLTARKIKSHHLPISETPSSSLRPWLPPINPLEEAWRKLISPEILPSSVYVGFEGGLEDAFGHLFGRLALGDDS